VFGTYFCLASIFIQCLKPFAEKKKRGKKCVKFTSLLKLCVFGPGPDVFGPGPGVFEGSNPLDYGIIGVSSALTVLQPTLPVFLHNAPLVQETYSLHCRRV